MVDDPEWNLQPAFNQPFEVNVLPLVTKANVQPTNIFDFIIEEMLDTFLITFSARATGYHHGMDDPFFSAHAQRTNFDGVFYADRETTALVCVEFIDICLASDGPDLCYSQEVR